mgnify:CR=1 FL=1
MAKAAGNSDSPEPVVTAPVVDSTRFGIWSVFPPKVGVNDGMAGCWWS